MSNIYPKAIQETLVALNDGTDWTDVYQQLPRRDRELTEVLCSLDCSDFIVMNNDDAFLFISDEQTGTWTVQHVGCPVYHVEPEMIGDGTVNFDDFLAELQHELPGVEIRHEHGAALSNHNSVFVQQFNRELNRAFQNTLDYCF